MNAIRKNNRVKMVILIPGAKRRKVTDSDSSDDDYNENYWLKTAPRYYPSHSMEVLIISLDGDLKKTARVKKRLPFLKPLDLHFLIASTTEEIVEILLAANCCLSDVVCLQNVELTKAFLKKMPWTCELKFEEEEPSVEPYAVIDADSRYSVDIVMNALDVQNAEVILTRGPGRYLRKRHFLYNIVAMATERRNLKVLKVFVQHIIEWNILDKEGCRIIEEGVFQKADKEVVRIFLQDRLDLHMKRVFGNDVVAALFANPCMKIGALKRKGLLDVNAAGYDKMTALHYAMARKDLYKIKFLLDRGADPNATTIKCSTPLVFALWEPTVNPAENKRCTELLLQYGADPFRLTVSSESVKFYNLYVHAKRDTFRRAFYAAYEPAKYLRELLVSYSCMWDADGAKNTQFRNTTDTDSFRSIVRQLPVVDDFKFYKKCQYELQTLKEHKVRRDLTMFTVASRTGKDLIRLVNQEDQKIITSYVGKYEQDMTINPFYVNAMREHMRQFRKLVAHRNRAMLIISESAEALAPYLVVLNKIVSYLTYTELLLFQ